MSDEDLIELCYVSFACDRMNSEELSALLKVSRENNSKKHITGLLLYDGFGTFIQMLEGEKSDVVSLYDKIKMDKRHARIHLLRQSTIQARSFPDWKMGFRKIDDSSLAKMKGVSQFLQQGDEQKLDTLLDSPSFAVEMLYFFKQKTKRSFQEDAIS